MVILSPFSNVRNWLKYGDKKPLVTDRWSLSVTGYFITIFSPLENKQNKIRGNKTGA